MNHPSHATPSSGPRRFATIAATGRYVPARRVTNADFEARLGEPGIDAWLKKNVGIEARHFLADDETTSDLAVNAARQALERAGVRADQLDLIIVATDTPDYLSPSTAAVVQHKLGATNAGVFDVNSACAGFVSALDAAGKMLAADEEVSHVLVVGAYAMSRYLDFTHKQTATLFADGAGAVVLRASDKPGLLFGKLAASGEYHDALGVYTGGAARPATREEVAKNGPPTVKFVRRFPPTYNTERWPPLVKGLLARAGMTLGDVRLFVFTQLNLRTIESVMETLGQPLSKTHWTMDRWGYTGSACIPMTLDEAVEHGKLVRGDHLVLCATGGGLASAATLLRWDP